MVLAARACPSSKMAPLIASPIYGEGNPLLRNISFSTSWFPLSSLYLSSSQTFFTYAKRMHHERNALDGGTLTN
jgi:hypothetical protein